MNLGLIATLGAAALALATCHHDRSAREQAHATAAATTAQSTIDRASAAGLDRAARRAQRSQAATDEATNAVAHTPSATDPLPADLLAAWRAGIGRVREQSDIASPSADREHPAQPDPAVPAP